MKFMMNLLVLLLAVNANASHGIFKAKSSIIPNTTVGIKAGNLQYYGGPVIAAVKLYTVFWGQNVDPTIKQGMWAAAKWIG